jgi:hypothetical protein
MAYIVRIDKSRTRAWQVRGSGKRGYHSKLFSDGKYGGKEPARAAAEVYLAELPPPARPHPANVPYHQGKPLASNTSGVTGVFRTHNYHGQTGQKQEYWAAFVPIGPYGRHYFKRFYINDERDEEEAFRLAVEFRQMWEEAALAGEKAIRDFFEAHEDGWL